MTETQLKLLGFSTEILPSGRINLYHPERFAVNGLTAYLCVKGKYTRTMEQRSIQDLCSYIKKVDFPDQA